MFISADDGRQKVESGQKQEAEHTRPPRGFLYLLRRPASGCSLPLLIELCASFDCVVLVLSRE
jgi:hypothetical protein